MNAEQKLRETLTGSPVGEPNFQHEGPGVVRWFTGGLLPDVWVTLHPHGERIEARCAGCNTILGYLPADRDPDQAAAAIISIREAGHEAHKPANWPR
jgi:hypothetical protein